MDRERMLQLRRVCIDAPSERFNMNFFTTPCGTAHCLFGWAWVDPWFRKNTTIASILEKNGKFFYRCRTFEENQEVLASLFGLGVQDARYLFALGMAALLYERPISKQEVLWNIDRILNGEPALPYHAYAEQLGVPGPRVPLPS